MHNRYICTLSRTYLHLHAFSFSRTSTGLCSPGQARRGKLKWGLIQHKQPHCARKGTQDRHYRELQPMTEHFVAASPKFDSWRSTRPRQRCSATIEVAPFAIFSFGLSASETSLSRNFGHEEKRARKKTFRRRATRLSLPPATNHYLWRCFPELILTVQRFCENSWVRYFDSLESE